MLKNGFEGIPMVCPEKDCKRHVVPEDFCTTSNVAQLITQDELAYFQYLVFMQLAKKAEKEICKTYLCEYAYYRHPRQETMECPICWKSYCLDCPLEAHPDMTCKEKKMEDYKNARLAAIRHEASQK